MDEKQAKINECTNLLQQSDYTGRKVAFEVAKLFKAQFPSIKMPIYEKYLDTEVHAEELRQSIQASQP